MKLVLFFAFAFVCSLSAQEAATGQYVFRKKVARGYESVNLTPENGKVIGWTAGNLANVVGSGSGGDITPTSVVASGNISGANLSGTNTGDQTTIVGITGTKAQFQTAMTDDDFVTLSGTQTLTGLKTFSGIITGAGGFTTENSGYYTENGGFTAENGSFNSVNGNFQGNGDGLSNLNASNLATGTVSPDRIADAALSIAKTSGLRTELDGKQTQLDDRLASYRMGALRATLNDTTAPVVGIMGDSMLANAASQLDRIIRSKLGFSGRAFTTMGVSGGATTKEDPTTWFMWNSAVLSGSGHTASIDSTTGTGPLAADTIKVYYASKPGGGVFKIQTQIDGGTWTDEAAYLTVSTDAAVAGNVITIAKTGWRKTYAVRCVWVSGNVDIIGGGLYLSSETGARIASFSAGGYAGNMPDWVTQNTAILNPILADVGLDLVIFSHLDGATSVNADQATWQNMINTGSGTAPAWMCIGPPASSNSTQHEINGAQAEAMRTLAVSRGDAFWDNKEWAGTSAQATANGYCNIGDQSHYTTLGINQWVTRMVQETAIFESTTRRPEEFTPSFGAKLRRFRGSPLTGSPAINEHQGVLRICNPDGLTGKSELIVEDSTGNGTTANDGITVGCSQFNIGHLGIVGTQIWKWRNDVGSGSTFYNNQSTAATPNGVLGITANPIREINLGKTINTSATTGNVTIDKVTGRVWFAAAGQTLTVTNARCTANSVIMATVLGSDATATSVRVTTISAGSFVLTLNAAATAATAVNFWVMP